MWLSMCSKMNDEMRDADGMVTQYSNTDKYNSRRTQTDVSSHSFIGSEGMMTAVDIMSLFVYKNALMLFLASSMYCWQTVAASSHCQPSESALRSWSIWAMRANHSHHSHHLSLISPTLTQTYLLPVSHTDLHTNPLLAGDDQCPLSLNQLQGEPLMHRSLCPWYWRINYDPLRIPSALPEAHCRCERAVTGNRLFACHTLTIRIRVGRLSSDCNEYMDEELELAVACVSVIQPRLIVDPFSYAGVQKTFIISADAEI